MGQITDRQITSAVAHLGTATASQIYDWFVTQTNIERKKIITIVHRKLPLLVKYGIVCSMNFAGKVWYYIEPPTEMPRDPPLNGHERLDDHIARMEYGDSITASDVMRIARVKVRQAYTLLSKTPLRYVANARRYYKVRP